MKRQTPTILGAALLAASTCSFAGDLAAGRYIINPAHSGKCVDVAGAGLTDGTNIQQTTCNNGSAQDFDIIETANGEYKLLAVVSAKAFDVAGASLLDKGNIQQWADNGGTAQRFFIRRVAGSAADFNIINKNSGRCLDVFAGSTADGANVQQFGCNGNPQQRFRFSARSLGSTVPAGRYVLRAAHSGKCMDVAASSTADGAVVQQYSCDGGAAQAFNLTRDSAGHYQLASAISGKIVEVSNAALTDGAAVQIWSNGRADNQRLSLFDRGNGQYDLRFKHSGKCIDVTGQYTTDSARLQQWGCNGQLNQRWSLTPATEPVGSSTARRRQEMLNFFHTISGSKTLVGVENKNSATPTSDTQRVDAIAGRPSSLWGGDFGFGSGFVNNRNIMIGEAKKQYAKGAVPTLMYHACSPARDEYCTWDDIGGSRPAKLSEAQFKELLTPGTALYNSWIGRLDKLAVHFQDLKNNNVVVLFRPLHEINQCVFWWSCHKGPYGSAQLFRLTRDYLVKTKGLDNIIWVWNVQDFTSLNTDVDAYTPGPDYFDIASLDVYNTGYTTGNYNTMLRIAAGKLIAIGEDQFVPSPTLLAQQPKWLFQMLWPDFIDDPRNRSGLPPLYQAGNVLTLDEMPGWK